MNQEREHKVELEIDYADALEYARTLVLQKYGTVRDFTRHEDFTEKCGFNCAEAHKVATYLSRPPEGEEKKVKSAPFLSKLLSALVGVELDSGREVVHKTLFWLSRPLPPIMRSSAS